MTRRERHLSIIQWHSENTRRWELDRLMAAFGLDALTDEAVETYARSCILNRRRNQKLIAENRSRRSRDMDAAP